MILFSVKGPKERLQSARTPLQTFPQHKLDDGKNHLPHVLSVGHDHRTQLRGRTFPFSFPQIRSRSLGAGRLPSTCQHSAFLPFGCPIQRESFCYEKLERATRGQLVSRLKRILLGKIGLSSKRKKPGGPMANLSFYSGAGQNSRGKRRSKDGFFGSLGSVTLRLLVFLESSVA